ncbi:MAG TPA: ABC transporter permease [Ilumatobacteraceae bacterium]|nr:ABC transporter permease [Ilumatobacteraceae bacterium]
MTEHSLEFTQIDLAEVSPEHGTDDLFDVGLGLAQDSASPTRLALRRFRHNPSAMFGLVLLSLIALAVIFAGQLARYGENERLEAIDGSLSYVSPNSAAWFGTDDINRDLFSRILYGGQVSLFIGIAVAVSACFIGTVVGTIAGYRGGKLDDVLMRVTDIFLAFPILVTLLVIRNMLDNIGPLNAIMGNKTSMRFMVILLSSVAWMGVARIVRGTVLSIKEREFIEAARALGASGPRIVVRHVVPNALGPIMVALTVSVVVAIIAETTLSFFGYGPAPGEGKATWGGLIAASDGAVLSGHWWIVVFPCLALVLTILAINFVGDGLRDSFDPKSSRRA